MTRPRTLPGGDALGLECKYQSSSGTTDEKIPYALEDLAAMWIPGCLVYAGAGWSTGVLHTLDGSKLAAFCDPGLDLQRTSKTLELDHVIAATFGLWEAVIPEHRRFGLQRELELPNAPLKRAPSGQRRLRKMGRESLYWPVVRARAARFVRETEARPTAPGGAAVTCG